MKNQSNSPNCDGLNAILDAMIAHRSVICMEHALTINHKHCIGCMLVVEHMMKNHPNMEYGTVEQWTEESAFCARHEREIFKDFLTQRGIQNVS